MKNNYKQLLSKSPSESSVFKRSASHSLRSSFRLPKKRSHIQSVNCSSLPPYVPPKAAALLEISMPSSSSKQSNNNLCASSGVRINNLQSLKVATIRRRSVWANSSAKISLPSSHENDREHRFEALPVNQLFNINKMHIGGFNLNKSTHQSKVEENTETMNNGSSILREINKNISSENFKVSKKHKLGHGTKKSELNVLCALFESIENNQVDKLKTLLDKEGGEVHINTINNDGLSPLDVAVLLENHTIIKILLQHGANVAFDPNESIEAHLNTLLQVSEQKLHQLSSSPAPSSSNPSGIIIDCDNQKSLYEKRVKVLKKMVTGWKNLQIPDTPFSFSVDVVGNNSVLIKILQPIENSVCTKVKVQYSSREDFSIIFGEKVIAEWKDFEGTMGVNFQLNNLIQGRRYYFRAGSGNIKGFGSFKSCNPKSIIPSSWKDTNSCEITKIKTDQKETFDKIFNFIELSKREDHQEDAGNRRNVKKKTTIKQLFTATSKFQKTIKRGIHLACICYTDDKVLLTNEEVIPVIEIDETYPNSLNNDFYWLMKISMSWDCVKELRDDMEKNALTKVQFRFKILNAIYQMQMALGTTDLGRFYYKPLKDSDGTVLLSCILNVKEQKSSMNLRWVPLIKLQKKATAVLEDTSSINEILMNSIVSQINFHQASRQKLSRGLYLGYLKMFSSFDTIQLVCQAKNPNVLPNCKIRDNPHVSAEEWSALQPKETQKTNASLCFDLDKYGSSLSEAQQVFIDSLKLSLTRLFKYMNISSETAYQHRLYDLEVVELDNDVTFLLICSPLSENAILTKDFHSDPLDLSLKRNDLLCLPLIVHEMLQFNIYQHETIRKYARLSLLIEFEIIVANLKHREAFSNNEIQVAKEKLKKLQEIMEELNGSWKGVRWMMDAINFARTKEQSGIDVKTILQFNNPTTANDLKTFKLPFQPSTTKFPVTSPIRGSWSGPQNYALKNSEIFMYGEHSKSEQVLNCDTRASATASGDSLQRQSSDSNYYSSGERSNFSIPRLPSSKSEDTLVVIRNKGTSHVHPRKRATTINTNSSGDSSEGQNAKSNGLIVHRINNTQFTNEPSLFEHVPNNKVDQSPSKSRLRVSHHPKANTKKEQKKFNFEANEESTLVTFLKPTLTAIQNESQNCSFKDPLLIVEDEAIEMISSPFRKAPVEHKSTIGKATSLFIRSNLHSKNVHAICQDADAESNDWRAVDLFKKVEDTSETPAFTSSQSDFESEENLGDREYVNQASVIENSSSILHVIAAYQTGLASGTSLKLKCQPKTTAKEVIELVVKQLNMAVIMKGKEGPIYEADKIDDFCLVAVIGARERCLRPDFRPLDLQNPWKKGKLFVRLKHDLLAAIEHSNRETFSI